MHLPSSIGTLCLTLPLVLTPLHAQTDHPASAAPITRAVAVYEWTGPLDHPTAARLIPVSLFLDNHLEDAGVYLAQPIPLALQPGDLYLIQRSGETEGAFAVQSAHSIPTPHNPLPAWFGYGNFLTTAETIATIAPPPLKPSLPPPPDTTLTHPKHEKHKHHHDPQPTPQPATAKSTHPAPPPTPPPVPELTLPLPPDLHQAIAISDPINRPPESFSYTWPTPTSRDETLKALEALALPSLIHYAAFNHLSPATAAPTETTGPTFANAPTLTRPQLLAFTLSPSTPPTYILTAESPLAAAGPIYITLIAQPNSNNQPHTLLLSITDVTHLDRTPRLHPIGAADPEATGHADLLFELRSQATRQFALYDLTDGQPHQVLLTNPIH